MMKNNFILLFILLSVLGCNPQDSSVEIKTGGIFEPITFGIENQDLSGKDLDLGEWVTTDGAKLMTVTVSNNTLFPYTEIDLTFSPLLNEYTAMRFKPLETGEAIFPGNGGTCERTLAPGTTCTILVELLPPIDGEYKEQLHLSFKNYVDFENHIGTIYILSGIPAELAIQDIPSRIRFGDIVGSDALVERTIPKTYTQAFTIKNVGGLSARSIIINNINICKDTNDNYCDAYTNAYSIESLNCKDGDRIKKGETCDFILSYTPKNNIESIEERYERIRYEGGLTVEYIKNPTGSRSTLGINYDSMSSKIEGRLISSASVDLSNNGIGIVQGNRTYKDIRAINVGYRSLRVNKIRVTKPSLTDTTDQSWVMCEKGTADVLNCFDEADSNKAPKPLKDFPFIVRDLDSCVGSKDVAPLITIGSGCNFRVTFQPSSETHFVNPANPTDFTQTDYDKLGKDIKIFVIYDSQWKDGENHCDNQVDCDPLPESSYRKTNFSFKVKAKRKSAARLDLVGVKYNNVNLTSVANNGNEINNSPSTDLNILKTFDFGRLALLANSQKSKVTAFKKLQLTFKNIGQDSAFLDKITFPLDDTTSITIPHDTQALPLLNDSNNCIGTSNHCYFRNAKVLGDCTEISSEQLCTLEILFAPFVFTDTSFDKNKAMYNYPFPEGLTAEKFKSFTVSYNNGSQFLDTDPFTTTANFPKLKNEVRLRATLTEKGQLEEIADDPDNFKSLSQGILRGSKVTYKMRLTNVGSGRVSKINMALTGTGYAFSAPVDCSVLPKDCRCYSTSTENCLINETTDSLPSDGECFLPLSWEQSPTSISAELSETLRISGGQVPNQERLDDIFRVDYPNFTSTASIPLKSNLSYYDCYKHTSTELANNLYGANYDLNFGYPITQPEFTTTVSPLYQPLKLVPYIPASGTPTNMGVPWHTTLLGRMAITTSPGFVERIFYNLNNSISINAEVTTPFLEPTSSLLLGARDSYKYPKNIYLSSNIQSILTANEDNTIKYYYFMGSFPRYTLGSGVTSFKVPFIISNVNNSNNGSGSIKSIDIASIAGMGNINLRQVSNNVELSPILTTNSSYDYSIPLTGTVGYTAEINPSLCTAGKCLYGINVLLTYDTGKRDQNRVGSSWVKSCSIGTDTFCERKIRIVIFGEVDSNLTSPIKIDSSLVAVNLSGNSMYETCNNPYTEFTAGTWNQSSGGTALPLSSLKYSPPVPANAAYDKRVIKITNTSSSDIKIRTAFLRSSNSSPDQYNGTTAGIFQNHVNTNASSDCSTINNNFCTNDKILAPNGSCYTTVRYQPTGTGFINASLSFLYTSNTSQQPHNIYNVPLSFQPILPALLRPVSSTGANLATNNVKSRLTGNNTIGTTQNTIGGVFKVSIPAQTFSQTSPTQVVNTYIKILNNSTTKASLLYEWRLFNNSVSGDPDSSAFATDSSDSRSYVQIGENTLQFMKIYASRQCLYGSDTVPVSTSGFTSSEQNCFLKISIFKKHNNMLNTSNINTADTIDPYIYRIRYYSAGRSTTNHFAVYVEYNSTPASFAATSTAWGTITSVGLTTTLNFPAHTASTPDTGTIVGYRVIRTRLVGSLTDFFNLQNTDITRLDVYNTTSPQAIFTAPSTETGRIYHYKVLAIRQHPNFTRGDVWFGFAANRKDHFITDITNFNFVKVIVPPAGNIYFYQQKLLIDTARWNTMEDYQGALNRCTVKSVSIKNGNLTTSVPKSILNSTAWGVLPSADQSDPLWIYSASPITFTSMCPAMEAFEYTDITKKCFRSSLEITQGREIRGNLFEYDLLSPAYIEPTLYYGYSRCMTNLSSLL